MNFLLFSDYVVYTFFVLNEKNKSKGSGTTPSPPPVSTLLISYDIYYVYQPLNTIPY